MNTEVKKHNWLFAAQLVFRNTSPDSKADDGGVIMLNGLVLTDEKQVALKDLGRAQMQAVANLNERFKGQKIEVIDCVFMSFSYLGYMSAPEYAANPEGQIMVQEELPLE